MKQGLVMGQHLIMDYPADATSLEEMGYKFISEAANPAQVEAYNTFNLTLVDKNEQPFLYYTEDHYDKVGTLVYEYLQQQMKSVLKMEELWLPLERKDKIKCNVFATQNALTTEGKLAIFVTGNRIARPGAWARSLCINKDLQIGSLLPYLEMVIDHGFEALVLNPNCNAVGEQPIPYNKTPEMHLAYCWEKLIKPCKASQIVFIPHYYGGVATLNSLMMQDEEQIRRVSGIAFLDSLHRSHISEIMLKEPVKELLKNRSIHWRVSEQPAGSRRPGYEVSWDTPIYSAGTMSSERVPGHAFPLVTSWFAERFPKSQQVSPAPVKWQPRSASPEPKENVSGFEIPRLCLPGAREEASPQPKGWTVSPRPGTATSAGGQRERTLAGSAHRAQRDRSPAPEGRMVSPPTSPRGKK